jgi:hypothetical protein
MCYTRLPYPIGASMCYRYGMLAMALGIYGLGLPELFVVGMVASLVALPVVVVVLIVRGLSHRPGSGPVRYCPHCGQQIPVPGVFCCFCGQRTA